jgi:hypothetical protein
MTAVWQPPGQQSFFLTRIDVNGNPYTVPNAGGFVYMYQPGSTVPQTTWLDSAQSTANTNPIRLDPDGRCVIYGVGQYRQIVTDPVGSVQWDQLVELGIDQTFVSEVLLTAPVLVDGPNPNPPLSNPDQGTRALAAVLGSFVDARNGKFGALRQGGDDLVVLQAAINYAASIGGATIYTGPGPLTTAGGSTLAWPANASGVSLKGDGPFTTVLTINGNVTSDVFTLVAGNLNGCQIRDMGFFCGGTPGHTALIHCANTVELHIENVEMTGAFWDGVLIEGGTNQTGTTVRDLVCSASSAANACIVVGSDLSTGANTYIDTCRFSGSQFGIYLRNAATVQINDSQCVSHGQSGLITSPPTGQEVKIVQATGLFCDSCGQAGINLGTSGGNTSYVSLGDCSSNRSGYGILIGSNPQVNVISIIGCQIHVNGNQGIRNVGANAVLITNNLLVGNGTQAANAHNAIQIESGIQNVVSNNYIGPGTDFVAMHKYAIELQAATDYCVITGNVTGSGGTGSILNSSTGTHNVVTNNTGT